jgi:hypothetical protein
VADTSQGELRRRKSSRQDGAARRILRQYRFELTWLIVVALGLFLVLEQMNIRASLARWFREAVARLFSGFQQFDNGLVAFLARVSISDVVGFLLLTAAVVAVLLRLRWRLLNNAALATVTCPKCGGPIHRVHRTTSDRFLSLYVPVRRYRCHSPDCGWHGLRVGKHGSPQAARSPS